MRKEDKNTLINELLCIKDDLKKDLETEKWLIEVREQLENYGLEYSFRYLWEERMTWDELDEMVRYTAEYWALRMYYFMWDVNFASADLVKLDGYWNCEEATYEDLRDEIDNIIENVDSLDEDEE